MTVQLVVQPPADRDLADILDWLAANASEPIATQMIARIERTFEALRAFPFVGAPRDDLRAGLRMAVEQPYVILHYSTVTRVDILRVVHGARDLPAVLREMP